MLSADRRRHSLGTTPADALPVATNRYGFMRLYESRPWTGHRGGADSYLVVTGQLVAVRHLRKGNQWTGVQAVRTRSEEE